MYCSRQCFGVTRRTNTEVSHTFVCEGCGKIFPRKRYQRASGYIKYYVQQKVCSNDCKADVHRRTAKERFEDGKVGRHIKRHGYVWLSIPALLSPTGKKIEMLEHRWVMEKHLGRRLLPEETVHHINGDRAFNKIENLELFSSRHGPGQRVVDKVRFAIEILRLYPEFTLAEGFTLMEAPKTH